MRAVGDGHASTAHRNRLWRGGRWQPYERKPLTAEQKAAREARARRRRAEMPPDEREAKLARRRARHAATRAAETPEAKEARRARERPRWRDWSKRYYDTHRDEMKRANRGRAASRKDIAGQLAEAHRAVHRAAHVLLVKAPDVAAALLDPPPVTHPRYLRWVDAVWEAMSGRDIPRCHRDTIYGCLIADRALDKQAQSSAAGDREVRLTALVEQWQAYREQRRKLDRVAVNVRKRRRRLPVSA